MSLFRIFWVAIFTQTRRLFTLSTLSYCQIWRCQLDGVWRSGLTKRLGHQAINRPPPASSPVCSSHLFAWKASLFISTEELVLVEYVKNILSETTCFWMTPMLGVFFFGWGVHTHRKLEADIFNFLLYYLLFIYTTSTKVAVNDISICQPVFSLCLFEFFLDLIEHYTWIAKGWKQDMWSQIQNYKQLNWIYIICCLFYVKS